MRAKAHEEDVGQDQLSVWLGGGGGVGWDGGGRGSTSGNRGSPSCLNCGLWLQLMLMCEKVQFSRNFLANCTISTLSQD